MCTKMQDSEPDSRTSMLMWIDAETTEPTRLGWDWAEKLGEAATGRAPQLFITLKRLMHMMSLFFPSHA